MKKLMAICMAVLCMVGATACGKVTEKDVELVSGTVSGQTYVSEFGEFQFTAPEGWVYATDEEILNMMNLGKEYLSDKQKLSAELGKQKTVYDAMAQDAKTGCNVMVMYENLALSLGGTNYTAEDYADVVSKQLPESGLPYVVGEKKTVTVCEKEFVRLDATADYQGVKIAQSYLLRKIGKYMLAISVTAPQGSNTEDIIALLAPYNAEK